MRPAVTRRPARQPGPARRPASRLGGIRLLSASAGEPRSSGRHSVAWRRWARGRASPGVLHRCQRLPVGPRRRPPVSPAGVVRASACTARASTQRPLDVALRRARRRVVVVVGLDLVVRDVVLEDVIGIECGYFVLVYQNRSSPLGMPSAKASMYWSQVPLKLLRTACSRSAASAPPAGPGPATGRAG